MTIGNYSPINNLLVKKYGKEGEPRLVEPFKHAEVPPEKKEAQTVLPPPPPPKIEIIPELPEIDDDLKDEGIALEDHDTIFVSSRRIDLPLPLEEVEEGLHKPLNSGWRWIAELTKYILARFHIVIKKVGQKLKLVEQN